MDSCVYVVYISRVFKFFEFREFEIVREIISSKLDISKLSHTEQRIREILF